MFVNNGLDAAVDRRSTPSWIRLLILSIEGGYLERPMVDSIRFWVKYEDVFESSRDVSGERLRIKLIEIVLLWITFVKRKRL